MNTSVEKLICCVKDHPILYDPNDKDYKNAKMKDEIWNEIGIELNESGDVLKKKWKNLHDRYARYVHIQKTLTEQTYNWRYHKAFPWAEQMDIFRPFLKCNQTEPNEPNLTNTTNISIKSINREPNKLKESKISVKLENGGINEPLPEDNSINTTVPVRRSSVGTYFERVLSLIKEERETDGHCSNYNSTELMFLSFAKTVNTFSLRRQIMVKSRISKIILEEELLEQQKQETASLNGTINSDK